MRERERKRERERERKREREHERSEERRSADRFFLRDLISAMYLSYMSDA